MIKNEIFTKSKVDYKYFKDYFYQAENEYAIHNSYEISDNKFVISGLGILNLLHDYKIEILQTQEQSNYIQFKLSTNGMLDLDNILEFYISNHNGEGLIRLKLEYIMLKNKILI